jgi:deoxyinosine 3'endonuclease (endonuclease V)
MLDLEKLKTEQNKIASKIVLKDFVKINKIKYVAGVDSSYICSRGIEYCVNVIVVLEIGRAHV